MQGRTHQYACYLIDQCNPTCQSNIIEFSIWFLMQCKILPIIIFRLTLKNGYQLGLFSMLGWQLLVGGLMKLSHISQIARMMLLTDWLIISESEGIPFAQFDFSYYGQLCARKWQVVHLWTHGVYRQGGAYHA